ncbi:MAG: Flp family type IVb pilin [Anaerolineae bacterium]|nr:Flp family type IVb pilin [Anaerolineae bacterium]
MLPYVLAWLRTLRREDGQDLAEYALLIALIAIVVITAVTALGGKIETVFNAVANKLNVPGS